MVKYQVWLNDSLLVGHLIGYTHEAALARMGDYARNVWDDDITNDEVSLCEIPLNYYDSQEA